jgi:RNA polymerase sigma-70 factor (ECF subfamily)
VDETILIQKSQRGDMDAFEQLLLRYEKKVYTIAYKYMGNAEDASDLAQEALIKAYQSIGTFRGESSFGTWIGRITANKCLDELRKRKELQTTSLDEELELEEGSVQKEIVSERDTPEQHTIRQETVHYVQQKLQQMKEEYRMVLVLRELEGHSYEDIADMLNCSLGTVKSRISRARNYLKELVLADQHKEGSQNGAGNT